MLKQRWCDWRMEPTRRPRIAAGVIAGTAIALIVGIGAAAAIGSNDVLSPTAESKAIIDDAASQLGVRPGELSSALKNALKNRVDAAVEAGRLTEEQATELKKRIDSDELPLLGRGGLGGPGFQGHGPEHVGRGEVFAAAAAYLGLTQAELRSQLADQTLAGVAKEQGKSVSGLVDAMVAAAETSVDQAVADGKLTPKQANELKAGLEKRMTDLVNGELEPRGMYDQRSGPMHGGEMGPPWRFEGPPA